MKSLNMIFAAVIVTAAMCSAQVGYAQYRDYADFDDYQDALVALLGKPSVSGNGITVPVNTLRDVFSQQSTWFHDTHAVSWFDVGKVYVRPYGSSSLTEYTGPLNWKVRKPGGGTWAEGTTTYSNPGPVPTNLIRVTRGALIGTPAGTVPSGAIYALTAELDGEFYGGYTYNSATHQSILAWAMTDTWRYPNGNSNNCSSSTCKWTPADATNAIIQQFSTPPNHPNRNVRFGNPHQIYLHPKSTVSLTSIPGGTSGSKANLPVVYFRNAKGARRDPQYTKLTDSTGKVSFHVNYNPSAEGFAVLYDGCWHLAPQINCNLCFGGDIYMGGRVTLTVRRFDGVALPNCQVWVMGNSSAIFHTPEDSPLITDSYGRVYFTPPNPRLPNSTTLSGQPFALMIKIGNEYIYTGMVNAPATAASLDCTHYNVILTSPANGATYANGSYVPFRWNTISGASTYILWLKKGTGSWQGYNIGNYAGIDVSVTGIDTWLWDVEARNSSGQTVGQSASRTFNITQNGLAPFKAPVDPLQMNRSFDELLDGEFGDDEDSLDTEEFDSMTIVQDGDGNVLAPIQGLKRVKPIEAAAKNTIEILEQVILPSQDDDWFDWFYQSMTPEEYLYFQYLFGL